MKPIRIQSRVIILNDDNSKILLVKNKNKNFWYLPGGGLENNETILQCAQREVFEEIGILVNPRKIVFVQELHDNKRQYFEFFMIANIPEDIVDVEHKDEDTDSEISKIEWFTSGGLRDVKVFPELLKDGSWDELMNRDDAFLGVLN